MSNSRQRDDLAPGRLADGASATPHRFASIGVDVRIDRIQMIALGLDDAVLDTRILPIAPIPTPGWPEQLSIRAGLAGADRARRGAPRSSGIGFRIRCPAALPAVTHEIWGWTDEPMTARFRRHLRRPPPTRCSTSPRRPASPTRASPPSPGVARAPRPGRRRSHHGPRCRPLRRPSASPRWGHRPRAAQGTRPDDAPAASTGASTPSSA
ncbi:hypothetical protein quinque_003540 [Culex quinquefasciatus]